MYRNRYPPPSAPPGQSKYGIFRTFAVLLDLITILYLTRFSLKPMRLFGGLGAAGRNWWRVLGLITIAMKLAVGLSTSTGNPLLYASLFGIMIGLQFTLMGMTAEMHTRTHYESQSRRPYAISRFRGFEAALAPTQQSAHTKGSISVDRAA